MKTFNKLFLGCLIIVASVVGFFPSEKNAEATGPSSCPAGKTALAQKHGTSQYCTITICVNEYKHIDTTECTWNLQAVPPVQSCIPVKYEARPRFPQPPSPAGSWGNQAACPSYLNTAGYWY